MKKEISPGLAAAVIILVVVVALVALIIFTNPRRAGGDVTPANNLTQPVGPKGPD